MLPPTLVRRFALVPLVVVIAACLVALTPLVALASWASALVRRWTGRGHRSRPLRVAWLALTWSVGEMAALTVLLCLWIVSGFGGRLDTEPYRTRHYAVMGRFLNQIYRAAERACGLRVEVAGPPDEALTDDRPVIVLQPARRPRRLAARRPPPAHGLRPASPGGHEGDPPARPELGHRGQPGSQRLSAPPLACPSGQLRHWRQAPGRPDQAGQTVGGRPQRARRAAAVPRGRELDAAALASGYRAYAAGRSRRSGRTGGGDA